MESVTSALTILGCMAVVRATITFTATLVITPNGLAPIEYPISFICTRNEEDTNDSSFVVNGVGSQPIGLAIELLRFDSETKCNIYPYLTFGANIGIKNGELSVVGGKTAKLEDLKINLKAFRILRSGQEDPRVAEYLKQIGIAYGTQDHVERNWRLMDVQEGKILPENWRFPGGRFVYISYKTPLKFS